ncbi:MAG TPA: serine protease [Trebonia sp.]|nr:serine protease [Trebonia sp.]
MGIRVGGKRMAALAAAIVMILVSGCSAAASTRPQRPAVTGPVSFWNRSRLLDALPLRGGRQNIPLPGQTPNAHTAATTLRVGALFEQDASGVHFCTASVVDSPGQNLLITAAHCINGGDGSGYKQNIVFIPDYRDGTAPFGIWTPQRLLVAPQWANSADPNYDVGFVVLQSLNGQNIQQVLGANRLGYDSGYQYLVRVTGYPDSAETPITCVNWTSRESATQLRFNCGGYTGGTSGSPWVTHYNPKSGTGTIVGVIGGYEQGGYTPSVSYSAYFGSGVQQLYQQAISGGTAAGPTLTPAAGAT